MSDIGYVVFDDPENLGQGWAARPKDDRASLIGGLHDLSSDTIWILNSEWDAMHSQQVDRHALYRQCRYLGPSLPKVVADLGIPADAAPEQALWGARITQRVIDLYATAFGVDAGTVPPGRLVNAVRERLAPPDIQIPAVLDQALMDSSEMFDWLRAPPEEGVDVTLRIHPLHYTDLLLSASVPDDQEEAVWVDNPPQTPTQEWVDANSPLLARVTVDQQNRLAAVLLNFGATSDPNSGRRFVTHYELSRLIASGAVLRVHQVVKWPANPTRFDAPRKMIARLMSEECGAFFASESVGLFAELLWRGVCARLVPPYGRKRRARYRNLAAPFLHALGRIHCATVAMAFIEDGFLVRRQGYGQIGVLMREGDDWKGLADHCARQRLVPPVFPAGRAIASYVPPPGIDPRDPFVTSLIMRARGLRSDLLNLDSSLSGWMARKIA